MKRWILATWSLCVLGTPVWASELEPATSPMWPLIHERFLQGEPVVFDPQVEILIPEKSEDSLHFPIAVAWRGAEPAQRILVMADLNPIIPIVDYYPEVATPTLATHIKIQQATPIRAAVLTTDGTWHVWAEFADAAGGGCTTPSVGTSSGNWADRLGEIRAAAWHRSSQESDRVRFEVQHPMDTGLANNIPKFIIDQVEIYSTETDQRLGRMELFEPVSENPLISLDFPAQGGYRIEVRDNNGLFAEGTVYPNQGALSQ